jgi:hypothetical protein
MSEPPPEKAKGSLHRDSSHPSAGFISWMTDYLAEDLGASRASIGYYTLDILEEASRRLSRAAPDAPGPSWRSSQEETYTYFATSLEAELRTIDPSWTVPVVVIEQRGFRASSLLGSSDKGILISIPTVTLLVRAFKYWSVLTNPNQLGYLSSAGALGSRRSLLASICDACKELFSSFMVHGFSTSPMVRLSVSGTALMEFVIRKSLLFLCLHEMFHLIHAGEDIEYEGFHADCDEEFHADCFALEVLIETDSTEYEELISNFCPTGDGYAENRSAFPDLFKRLEISPISEDSPWQMAIFAYVRILESLASTGGNEITQETRRQVQDVAYAVYHDDAERLHQDLDGASLPGFFWARTWTLFDDEPRLLKWGEFFKQYLSAATSLATFALKVDARKIYKTRRKPGGTS